MRNSTGSVRQRGTNSWELRIYQGVDPENGKERWATKTVRGSRRFATAQLREFRQVAICGRIRAGTVAELLTQWTEAASPGWAATTKRETKSLIDRHLIPCLGHLAIAKLTTADIDDFYGHLLRRGGKDERPLVWEKGATSGETFEVIEVLVNCEQNSLVYRVRPHHGGICYTRSASGEPRNCFYRRLDLGSMLLERL